MVPRRTNIISTGLIFLSQNFRKLKLMYHSIRLLKESSFIRWIRKKKQERQSLLFYVFRKVRLSLHIFIMHELIWLLNMLSNFYNISHFLFVKISWLLLLPRINFLMFRKRYVVFLAVFSWFVKLETLKFINLSNC